MAMATTTPAIVMQVSVDTPEKLAALLSFCAEKGISHTPLTLPSVAPLNLDTTPRKPTAQFKYLCGSMYLNAKGLISMRAAYEFVLDYIRLNRLRNGDGSLSLNEELREGLQTSFSRIYERDLATLVMGAFPA